MQSQTGSLSQAVCVQPFLQVFGADFAAVFFQIEFVDLFAFTVFREDGRATEFVLLAERGPCFFVLVQAVDVDEVDFAVQVAAGDVAFEHGLEGVAVAAARAADVGVNGVSVGDAFFEAFDGQAVEVEVDVGIGVFQPLGVFGGKAHGGLRFGQAVF